MFRKIICLYAAVVCALGAPSTDVVPLERQQPTVVPILEQSAELEANGTFKFSYEAGNGIQFEETSYDKVLPRTRSGVSSDDDDDTDGIHVQQGSYSYTAPDGTVISLRYIADENGFQPIGDHLPKPPPILVAANSLGNSARRSKTIDSAAQSSDTAAAIAPIAVAASEPVAPSKESKNPEALQLESRIEDASSAQQASADSDTANPSAPAPAPDSVASTPDATESQDSSTTLEVLSTIEVLSTAEPSASTTESVSTTTEQLSTTTVTSTEQPTTTEPASTPEASSEPSTVEEPASTPAASNPNSTPAESTPSSDAPAEASTTASA